LLCYLGIKILVINPEENFDHIIPDDFRDASMFRVRPDEIDQQLPLIAKTIKGVARRVQQCFGEVRKLSAPVWWGDNSAIHGSTRFVGRMREMWKIHSLLVRDQFPLVLGGSPLGQLRGLGGIGKSLLAEEYCHRFDAAYPGGIFWLRCHGNDDSKLRMSPEQQAFGSSAVF